jgi:hypothetical protein
MMSHDFFDLFIWSPFFGIQFSLAMGGFLDGVSGGFAFLFFCTFDNALFPLYHTTLVRAAQLRISLQPIHVSYSRHIQQRPNLCILQNCDSLSCSIWVWS